MRVVEVLVGRPSLVDRLGRAAAGARLLVVPQDVPGVVELVDAAYEAVAVVPDEPAHGKARYPVTVVPPSAAPTASG